MHKYLLITPAADEEKYIENTIRSLLAQRLLPIRWIIIVNGSSDRTEQIVHRYAEQYDFIQLIVMKNEKRDFSNKVRAIHEAYGQARDLPFDFIGILDADITIEPDYFQKLLDRFDNDPQLGIAGGIILEQENGVFVERYGNSSDYVAGAVQMFRRECWEQIGGYRQMKYAHEDTVATEMARMYGWHIKPFADLKAYHHRKSSTGSTHLLKARFHQGEADYSIGYHPLFELFKFVRRLTERPYIIGSVARLCGYLKALLLRKERVVPRELVSFLQKAQLERVRKLRIG